MHKDYVNRERLVETFIRLVKIKSFSGCESEVLKEITKNLDDLGVVYNVDKIGNLHALLPPSPSCSTDKDSPEAVMFCCHMDTVSIGDEINPVICDGIISSDGTSILGADDKAGIAAVLEAITVLKEKGLPHGAIELVFTVQEEKGLNGSKHFDFSALRSRINYVIDGSMKPGTIAIAAPYKESVDIVIKGVESHAGLNPEKGISAIQAAARAIDNMKLLRIDDETTANLGMISGGISENIVCPEVKIKGEIRSRSLTGLEKQKAHMYESVKKACEDYNAGMNFCPVLKYKGYEVSEDENIVRYFKKACRDVGVEYAACVSNGGSDANVFNNAGIKSVVVGTGVNNAHTKQESISIENLTRTTEIILSLISTIAKTGNVQIA